MSLDAINSVLVPTFLVALGGALVGAVMAVVDSEKRGVIWASLMIVCGVILVAIVAFYSLFVTGLN